ncbi:hypothetical protein GE061_015131 [Apolygus lucorum]|uniref:Uncharacterized protein n=1 Tax=Apolygus lucorum TaxID=248454 RepID=A0A8S9XLB7_APOLU|nr:hypothetical protein GE061_015131 [Apolygus lucorum]
MRKKKELCSSFSEALAEQSVRKSELKNKVDALNFRADQVQSQYAQAEIVNKKLCGAMKRLTKKEKDACRSVARMSQELEQIREKIHDTYREQNAYKKKIYNVQTYGC